MPGQLRQLAEIRAKVPALPESTAASLFARDVGSRSSGTSGTSEQGLGSDRNAISHALGLRTLGTGVRFTHFAARMHLSAAMSPNANALSVQGRVSNGADDACGDGATKASGLFLHLEQDYDKIEAIAPALERDLSELLPAATPM